MRRSVFWKVAALLVGAQVLTGFLAVGLSALLNEERTRELARSSLALRLDTVAEEVESRASFAVDGAGDPRLVLSEPLRLDLAARFPDPVYLLGPGGDPLGAEGAPLPEGALDRLALGRVVVELDDDPPWALAPLFDPEGVPAGGLLLRPLSASLERERAGTREATRRAYWVVGGIALASALLLGGLLTLMLVTPLRRVTDRVEALRAGDYSGRLPVEREDEVGRLAAAINSLAERVQASIGALQATDRLRRELVANIGHDLRTPLAGLQGYLEEADRKLGAGRPAEASEALATARRQSAHVEALVRDLFELSVLDSADRPPLRREPVPPAELLHHAAAAHRPAFAEASVGLEVTVPADLPIIQADGVRLLRVLDNLLANALRHTPPGGTVRLSGGLEGEHLAIRVQDTGEGMPPEVLSHLFERYYRGDSARTRAHEGSGLGLAIARAIARAHRGELTAESAPGEGSTLTLTLPLA